MARDRRPLQCYCLSLAGVLKCSLNAHPGALFAEVLLGIPMVYHGELLHQGNRQYVILDQPFHALSDAVKQHVVCLWSLISSAKFGIKGLRIC